MIILNINLRLDCTEVKFNLRLTSILFRLIPELNKTLILTSSCYLR